MSDQHQGVAAAVKAYYWAGGNLPSSARTCAILERAHMIPSATLLAWAWDSVTKELYEWYVEENGQFVHDLRRLAEFKKVAEINKAMSR